MIISGLTFFLKSYPRAVDHLAFQQYSLYWAACRDCGYYAQKLVRARQVVGAALLPPQNVVTAALHICDVTLCGLSSFSDFYSRKNVGRIREISRNLLMLETHTLTVHFIESSGTGLLFNSWGCRLDEVKTSVLVGYFEC